MMMRTAFSVQDYLLDNETFSRTTTNSRTTTSAS